MDLYKAIGYIFVYIVNRIVRLMCKNVDVTFIKPSAGRSNYMLEVALK